MSSFSLDQIEHLVRDKAGALVLYARQWCEVPEDVVQEAFLSLLRTEPWPENPLAWLYVAVRNGAINAARASRRRRNHEASAGQTRTIWFAVEPGKALDADRTRQALNELPHDQREVVIARVWGQLKWREIAELTSSGIATVHRRYQAGIAALRRRLDEFPLDADTSSNQPPFSLRNSR